MKLAVTYSGAGDDDRLVFARQLGATDVIASSRCVDTDGDHYEFEDLVLLKQRIEDVGMRLAGIANMPLKWHDKLILGQPGRDAQIESWHESLRSLGAAGIPFLGYTFFAVRMRTRHSYRTSFTTPIRGGATASSFDYELVRGMPPGEYGEISDEQMWDSLEYFIKAVVPVAEEAGVKLALHPDDPPISPFAGVARIFRSHEALRRLTETVPSDSNALTFCQGTISEMPESVIDAIRYFGSRNKIAYVHFRNVSGPVPRFTETFIDEGYVDMVEAMRAYKESGVDVAMVDDHVPDMVGDAEGQYRAHAHAMGYLQGISDAVGAGPLQESR